MAIFGVEANAKAQSPTTKTTKSSPPSVILTMGTQSVDRRIALHHRIVEIFHRVGAAVCAAYKEECVDEEDVKLDKAAKDCKSIQATLGYLQHLYRLMMFFGVLYVLLGASILTIAEDIAHLAPVGIPITAKDSSSVDEPYSQAYFLCGLGTAVVFMVLISFLNGKATSELPHSWLPPFFVFHTTALNTVLIASRFTAKFATAIHSGIQNHSADTALAAQLQRVQATLGCCGWTGPGDYSPSGNLTEPLPPLCPTRLAYSANPVQLLVTFSGQQSLSTGCQTSLLFTLLTVSSTGLFLCLLMAMFLFFQLSYDLTILYRRVNMLAANICKDCKNCICNCSFIYYNLILVYSSICAFILSLLICLFGTSHERQKTFANDSINFTLFYSAAILSGIFGHIAHRRQSVRLLDLFATTILPVLIFFNILSIIHNRTILEIEYVGEAINTANLNYQYFGPGLLFFQSFTLHLTLRISADLKRKAKAQQEDTLIRKIFSRFRERERPVQSSVRAKVTGPQVD